MRHLVCLLLLFFCLPFSTFSQNSEDCIDAHILADTPTPISSIPEITIDSLITSGMELSELGNFDCISPFAGTPDSMEFSIFTAQEIDKTYWFAFSAETNGTLELLITPNQPLTDYDFAIFKGFCPSDQCSQAEFCVWGTSNLSICQNYGSTGMADDPSVSFGIPNPDITQIVPRSLNLEAGQNYYLLVQNTNERLLCMVEDSIGFNIKFEGTATIGPLKDRPTINPITPPDTSQTLSLCAGDTETFAVSQVPFASTYDWISNSMTDATITPNALGDSVTVEFGSTSGQICMEMICPVQSLICWNIDIDTIPDLAAVPNATASCDPIDLSTIVIDNNNVSDARFSFFITEQDAIDNTNSVDAIATASDIYWIKKTTPNGCSDFISLDIAIDIVDISPIDTVEVCGSTIFALDSLMPDLSAESANPLNFTFYTSLADAENEQNFITPRFADLSSGNEYWVRGETNAGECFDIEPFYVRFQDRIEIDPILLPDLCGSTCLPLSALNLTSGGQAIDASLIEVYLDSLAAVTGDITNAINTEVCQSDTYWVRVASSESCISIAAFNVQFPAEINIDSIMPIDICGTNCLQLSTLNLTNESQAIDPSLIEVYSDSLAAATQDMTNIINTEICSSGIYWVRGETTTGECFDLEPINVRFQDRIEIDPIVLPDFCGIDCFQFSALNLTNGGQPIDPSLIEVYLDSLAAVAGDIASAISTEVCISGTYWARATSSQSCISISPFTVNLLVAPALVDLSIDLDCVVGCVNLADQIIIETNGLDPNILSFDYYASLAEAEDTLATPLTDLNICTPTDVWIRATNRNNGCLDVAQISILGMPPATATISGNDTICRGEVASLQIDFTGEAPFSLSYTDGMSVFDTVSNSNIFQIDVSPDLSTTYIITSLQDRNGCTGDVRGSATIIVNTGPIITTPSQDCNSTATEYRLTFEIIGSSNYQVLGIDGTLTDSAFVSDFIPSGAVFDFQVLGDEGCAPLTQSVAFTCECNSVVDLMDMRPIEVCGSEPAEGIYLGPNGENLEKEDVRFFVLHDSPTIELGNIVGMEDTTIFNFNPATMEHGTTYYMSAVITKLDMQGNPILNIVDNPCIAVSEGVSVVFQSVPEVSLSLSDSIICVGDMSFLTFNITGIGPIYDIIFFDGEVIRPLMGIQDGETIPVSVSKSTTFYVESITPSNILACTNTPAIADNEIALTIIDVPTIINTETLCNDEGSMLVLTFELSGGLVDSYTLADNSTITGTFKGTVFTSDSIPNNTPYTVNFTDANQCGIATESDEAVCLCTSDIAVEIETLKGVSCAGEKDAVLMATPVNGQAPFSYFWSVGSTDESVNNIAAGITSVSMTDANGCLRVDSIDLIEPRSLTASPNVAQPSCFNDEDGAIGIVQPEGGTEPYSFSFDGSPFGPDDFREDLPPGDYTLILRDDNGCEWSEEVTLDTPIQLAVALPKNTDISLGEPIELTPQINQEIISISWESLDTTICADCFNPIVSPSKSTSYIVTVMNESGCIASDQVLVRVRIDNLVFVPNAFSPNGDGNNDLLRPFGSSAVEEIHRFRVFNRWGELIYERRDMDMASNIEGWDGNTTSGRKAPTGIYLYFVEVSFKNGTPGMFSGDVSLVR